MSVTQFAICKIATLTWKDLRSRHVCYDLILNCFAAGFFFLLRLDPRTFICDSNPLCNLHIVLLTQKEWREMCVVECVLDYILYKSITLLCNSHILICNNTFLVILLSDKCQTIVFVIIYTAAQNYKVKK